MPCVLCLLLVLSGIAMAKPVRFERIHQWVFQGRFEEAAEELQQASLRSGRSLEQPRPVEEKILRKVIERARTFVNGQHPLQERNAARQVLCLSRAYFPEEISKIDQALRVGGGIHRPELIGEAVTVPIPSQARKAGIQGTVIVEVVIDQEVLPKSRILKGLQLGGDTAALATVRSWTFQPATLNGRLSAVYYTLTVSFPPRK